MREQIHKIADYYGKDAQAVQCVEELNELAAAILKYQKNRFSAEFDNVIEEMADAEIMLEQMKYLYGIGNEILDEVKRQKIDRQLLRIQRKKEVANE